MSSKFLSWTLFIGLCIIWGSSFILMKWGMYDAYQQPVLSPYQVAALRMFSSGLAMLPFLFRSLKNLPRPVLRYVLLSGWLGSFFPAFLFCIAETKIDGALTGSLNSLTPLFVIITGTLFFRMHTSPQKIAGVLVGLAGSALLLYSNTGKPMGYLAYTGFVVLATIFYGFNVNMVHEKLTGVSSVQIATIAFTGLIPASLLVLLVTGYFNLPLTENTYVLSTLASSVLGILGTALASVLFYLLVKKAGGLFASLVTYGIPFIAILWGVYYGEKVTGMQVIGLSVILLGVYLANRPEKKKATPVD
ncbi:MAG: DMT family transporter [Sphingobacteriales bacterium]|nr:DMT family transporter [Sphingobacteriales bacterium]